MNEVLPPLDAAPGSTLADAASRKLRDDIVTGVRRPGERLRIDRLREHYGVGASPLREALQRLSAEGLVLVEGNRGFTVAPLDPEEFADLTCARVAVEREALRLSILKGGSDWEGEVVSAAYLMSKADKDVAPGTDTWETANTSFHRALVSACGSEWLLRVRDNLHRLAERYRRASVARAGSKRDLGKEHAALTQAVLDRNIDLACTLIEQHYAKTEEELRVIE